MNPVNCYRGINVFLFNQSLTPDDLGWVRVVGFMLAPFGRRCIAVPLLVMTKFSNF